MSTSSFGPKYVNNCWLDYRELCPDVHVPQRMNPPEFGHQFSLILWNISTPPAWIGSHSASWLWSFLLVPMDFCEVWFTSSCSPQDTSNHLEPHNCKLVFKGTLWNWKVCCTAVMHSVLESRFRRIGPPNWDTANGMRLMLTVSWPVKEKVGLFFRAPGGVEPDQTEQSSQLQAQKQKVSEIFWLDYGLLEIIHKFLILKLTV